MSQAGRAAMIKRGQSLYTLYILFLCVPGIPYKKRHKAALNEPLDQTSKDRSSLLHRSLYFEIQDETGQPVTRVCKIAAEKYQETSKHE